VTGPLAARVAAADVFREPDERSEVVTQARLGDALTPLPSTAAAAPDGWTQVRMDHDGYEGWARREDLAPGPWPPPGRPIWLVTSLLAPIHGGPGVRHPLLLMAPLGAPLVLAGEPVTSGGEPWRPVSLPGGGTGFVHVGAAAPPPAWPVGGPDAVRESLARQARRLLGLPYRWGGTTPLGFDCSGLVQCLFRLHGIALPRDAKDQLADPRLAAVPRDALAPGDLLFFHDATHVGLAVSRDEFVHATTAGRPEVQASAVDDPRWTAARLAIRRVGACR
jgi:hypothetical protein